MPPTTRRGAPARRDASALRRPRPAGRGVEPGGAGGAGAGRQRPDRVRDDQRAPGREPARRARAADRTADRGGAAGREPGADRARSPRGARLADHRRSRAADGLRDPLGRETRRASAAGFVLEQAFDPVGQLMRQRAGREGQAGRAYAWDKAGAPTLIDDALFGPAAYRYDGNGQVAQASFGESLIERFDYDAARNVVGCWPRGRRRARSWGRCGGWRRRRAGRCGWATARTASGWR